MEITVDEDVKAFIIAEGIDFRLSTTCSGPALVPTLIKPQKDTDLKIPIGDQILYISDVQRRFVSRISMDMVYDPEKLFSCAALSSLRGLY